MAKRNAEIVLKYSTVYPFRLRGQALLCVYCSEGYQDPIHFRRHVDCNHEKFCVSAAFAHLAKGKDYLKVDCANLECRLCGEPFSNVKDTAKHLFKEHALKINLNYDIALQCYKLVKGKWFCLLCDAKLPNITKLCRHTVTAHYQKCTCDICGKTYMTIEGLRYHIKCNHSEKFLCRKCWKEFDTSQERVKHLKTSRKCWNFGCIYCGERFQSWEIKSKHLVEKHDCPEVKYPCSECDSVFENRKRFNNHYRKMHTDEAFVCSYCKKRFTTQIELKDHRAIHSGIEGHICVFCGKSFPKKFTLNQHMWIHSVVKPFECIPCNKQFNQKVSYKTHMQVHHSLVVD